MARAPLFVCAALLAVACAAPSPTPEPKTPQATTPKPEDPIAERFFATASDVLERQLEAYPLRGVFLGLHKYDGQVRQLSAEALAADMDRLRTGLERLRSFEPTELPARARVERAALITALEADLFELEVRRSPWRNPMFYMGELELTPYISRAYAPLPERARALSAAARGGVEVLARAQQNLEAYLPQTFVDTALLQVRGTISFVETDVPAALAGLAKDDQAELDAALAELLGALRGYEAFLVERQASATADFALGPETFREMLVRTQGLDIDLATLERIAAEDLERNLALAEAAAKKIDPDKSLAEVMAEVAADKPALDAVLAEATQQAREARQFLIERELVTIPSDNPVEVVETPAFMRWNSAFLDGAGPFEERPLPSFYYISPPDPAWPEDQQRAYVPSKSDLLFITVHEVWPGHFLHGLHVAANDSHILQALWNFSTGEGWAHYSEEMMWEQGLREDPRVHLGQLQNALLRNVRFVCALGLHTQGMSVETCTERFEQQAFQDPVNAGQQAVRGTFDPMYLGYTLGKLVILDLRADWLAQREAAGQPTDLRLFHDELLGHAAAPLPAIREAMLGPEAGPPLQ